MPDINISVTPNPFLFIYLLLLTNQFLWEITTLATTQRRQIASTISVYPLLDLHTETHIHREILSPKLPPLRSIYLQLKSIKIESTIPN